MKSQFLPTIGKKSLEAHLLLVEDEVQLCKKKWLNIKVLDIVQVINLRKGLNVGYTLWFHVYAYCPDFHIVANKCTSNYWGPKFSPFLTLGWTIIWFTKTSRKEKEKKSYKTQNSKHNFGFLKFQYFRFNDFCKLLQKCK